jgi:hypothetical protein
MVLQASAKLNFDATLEANTPSRTDEIVARLGGGVAPVQGGTVVQIEAADEATTPQNAIIPFCIEIEPAFGWVIPAIADFIADVAPAKVPPFAGMPPTEAS